MNDSSSTIDATEPAKRGPGRPPKAVEEPKPVTLIPVKLLKHYRPRGVFEIVDAAPSPLPGIGFTNKDKDGTVIGVKLWADTVVKLPRDEAAALLGNEAVSMEAVLGSDGKAARNAAGDIIRHAVKKKFPLAERADPLPV